MSKLGFNERQGRGDHFILELEACGKIIAVTGYSQSWNTIDDGMIAQLARQLSKEPTIILQSSHLRGLMDCSNSRNDLMEWLNVPPECW